MRKRCLSRKFIWCTRCWYGTTLLCAEGRQLTWRGMFRALGSGLFVLWARRLQFRATRLLTRAYRLDSETVDYLDTVYENGEDNEI